MESKRLEYLDFCKVLAMFMVTMAHCAQRLSGEQFPSLFVSKDSFISVNMAIFMIASGFVMNIDKMKSITTKDYILSKVCRLLVPMTVWFLVICIVSKQLILSHYWSYYWYLSAMFLCLSFVKLLTNMISNLYGVCLMSVIVLSLIPLIEFERSCYMIPFLWVGYLLRFCIHRIGWFLVIILIMVYILLYSYWEVDTHSVFSLIFRFLIGSVGGVAFISLSRLLIRCYGFRWIALLANFGRYTLVFYTMSFVLNAILERVMWHCNYITTPGYLDLASFVMTILMMVVMYYFQVLVEKNKYLCLFLLGIYKYK